MGQVVEIHGASPLRQGGYEIGSPRLGRVRTQGRGRSQRVSASRGGELEEGGLSKLLIQLKQGDRGAADEQEGREFQSLLAGMHAWPSGLDSVAVLSPPARGEGLGLPPPAKQDRHLQRRAGLCRTWTTMQYVSLGPRVTHWGPVPAGGPLWRIGCLVPQTSNTCSAQ